MEGMTEKEWREFVERVRRLARENSEKDFVAYLPEGVPLQVWVRVHIGEFINAADALITHLGEKAVCSEETCPLMDAGPGYTYTWRRARTKPEQVSAQQYMYYLRHWAFEQVGAFAFTRKQTLLMRLYNLA